MEAARERDDERREDVAVETPPVAAAAAPEGPSLAALQAVVVLPALPLMACSCVVGYLATTNLITGFHMMVTVWPLELLLIGVGLTLAYARVARWRREGRLGVEGAFLAGVLTLAAMGTVVLDGTGAGLGRRVWEHTELAPRATALRELFASPEVEGPVSVAGLSFPRAAACAEGIRLHTVEGGGPWPGWGLIVARPGVIPKSDGQRYVTPTSVEGIHWFSERL